MTSDRIKISFGKGEEEGSLKEGVVEGKTLALGCEKQQQGQKPDSCPPSQSRRTLRDREKRREEEEEQN